MSEPTSFRVARVDPEPKDPQPVEVDRDRLERDRQLIRMQIQRERASRAGHCIEQP